MNIEYELFKKSTFNYPNLIKYGFIKELNGYKYEKNILNSNFKIIINVKDNKLTREYMETILEQEKPNQKSMLKLDMNRINNVLPTNLVTKEEKEDYVVKAVGFYGRWLQKKREKEEQGR